MNDIWAIAVFFSPARFRSPVANYHLFAASLARQGLPLLTVELAFPGCPFLLPDHTNIIRVRGGDIMWQKERLLNHALTYLPDECDKVAWIDADILWPDATWIDRARLSLSHKFDVVQLFDGSFRLLPGQKRWTEYNPWGSPLWWEAGTAFHLVNDLPFERTNMGFAWAARREWLERIGGFYDRSILGSGDYIMLNAIFDRSGGFGHSPFDDDIAVWQEKVRESKPRVGYIAATICHLFHGNISKRRYVDRHLILAGNDYHPKNDIVMENYVWRWATSKPALHAAVSDYFLGRKEDENWIDESQSHAIVQHIR